MALNRGHFLSPVKFAEWRDTAKDAADESRCYPALPSEPNVKLSLATSSLSAPRITILIASSDNGRCNAFASSHGARIQTSRSSTVVRITGMAFGWIGSTMAFGAVVRKP
jgi:hypothetical protein